MMMKKIILLSVWIMAVDLSVAGTKDSVNLYTMPDSVKAVNFISVVSTRGREGNEKYYAGIRTSDVSLFLDARKKRQRIVFITPKDSWVLASGLDVKADKNGRMEWAYPWTGGENYKLYIASAADSAGNFVLYSGYIFLTKENKWKLIGTCKISGKSGTMTSLQSFSSTGKTVVNCHFSDTWVQGNNGSWFNLGQESSATPAVIPLPSIDSIRQMAIDQQIISKAITNGKIKAPEAREGIYYEILKEGSGRSIIVNDTITVFYKGTLFNDGSVFNQTDNKPSTFPLNRLIKGWQVGLSGTKVGGRIKLIIPSVYAYGIRTRAAKIPPNSILVFEIETVDAKESKTQ
jgi:FKBP-type peptidyl-prolyl cis-trans isomerase FkpA